MSVPLLCHVLITVFFCTGDHILLEHHLWYFGRNLTLYATTHFYMLLRINFLISLVGNTFCKN